MYDIVNYSILMVSVYKFKDYKEELISYVYVAVEFTGGFDRSTEFAKPRDT